MQIRQFAIEPLGRVVQRFRDAATGVAAAAAKAALIEWLKSVIKGAVGSLFS